MSLNPNVILVHGAFTNAGCWSKLVPLLRAKRFNVVASNCPLSSLADDAAAVQRTISMQNGPVLLVGHSWGGAIITEAGNDTKVKGLVYISAGAPDSNQSFNEWWEGYPSAPGAAEIKPYGTDRMALTLDGFRQFFAQDLGTDEIELLYCLQGPYASAANDEKISKAAWKGKPSWFIYGENDQMLLKELERDSATRMGAKTLVLPSSHVPMLSHPAEVANFVETAAREMGEASN